MPLSHLRQLHAHCAPVRGRTVASGRNRPQVLLRLHPVQFTGRSASGASAGGGRTSSSMPAMSRAARASLTAMRAFGALSRRRERDRRRVDRRVHGNLRCLVPSGLAPTSLGRRHWRPGVGFEPDWDGLGAQDGVRRLWLGVYPGAAGLHGARLSAVGSSTSRSGSVLNRTQYPSEVITLVVLWRLRYRRTLQDLTEMFLQRGIVLATRLSMSGRRSSHPF